MIGDKAHPNAAQKRLEASSLFRAHVVTHQLGIKEKLIEMTLENIHLTAVTLSYKNEKKGISYALTDVPPNSYLYRGTRGGEGGGGYGTPLKFSLCYNI